jgi:hypothetical protein
MPPKRKKAEKPSGNVALQVGDGAEARHANTYQFSIPLSNVIDAPLEERTREKMQGILAEAKEVIAVTPEHCHNKRPMHGSAEEPFTIASSCREPFS